MKDTVLVPDFICLVGSYVERPDEAHDVDVLVRAEAREDDRYLLLQAESVMLAIRDALREQLAKPELNIHLIAHAQGPHHGEYVPVADLVLRWREPVEVVQVKAAGGLRVQDWRPMKPAVRYYTENFSPDQLWESWGATRAPFVVQPKWNGYRCLVIKRGDTIAVYFEDARKDRAPFLKPLVDELRSIPHDFVLDGDLGLFRKKDRSLQRLPRPDHAALVAKTELDWNRYTVVLYVFDILELDGETISSLPLSQRRQILERITPDDLTTVSLTPEEEVSSLAELRRTFEKFAKEPGSEGIVAKDPRTPYVYGASAHWGKIKVRAEFRVRVSEVRYTKDGRFVYECQWAGGEPAGATMSTAIEADVGDTITVAAPELNLVEHNGWTLTWENGQVMDVTSDPPYTKGQARAVAERYLSVIIGEEKKQNAERPVATLIGSGAMNSPRLDACLLVKSPAGTFLFDGGQDVTPEIVRRYADSIDAMFISDPGGDAAPSIRRLAEALGTRCIAPEEKDEEQRLFESSGVEVVALPVKHTNRPTFGYLISVNGTSIAWAPEFSEVPDWLDDVDFAFVEASSWSHPIRFIGGVGGHAAVVETIAELRKRNIGTVVLSHIGKQTEEHLGELEELGGNVLAGMDGMEFPLAKEHQMVRLKENRSEISESWWEKNWHNYYGAGEYVVQHHWRGLTEDELQLSDDELLARGHSVHADIRFRVPGKKNLWGFTVYADAEHPLPGISLPKQPDGDAMRGGPKLPEPESWFDIAREGQYVAKPGEAGATSRKYGIIREVGRGSFRPGVWNRHMQELVLDSSLQGRYLIQRISERVWIISRRDEEPIAARMDKDEAANWLRRRGHSLLIWAIPGERPEFIHLKALDRVKNAIITALRRIASFLTGARKPIPYIIRDNYIIVPSTNAYTDLEGEIVTDESIQRYLEQNPNGTGTINYAHLPLTFADVVAAVKHGKYLFHVGQFRDDLVGRAFKKFLSEYPDGHPDIAPLGWGSSMAFVGLRDQGDYRAFVHLETSILPLHRVANPWVPAAQTKEGNMTTLEELRTIGGEALVQAFQQIASAVQETEEELDSVVEHKSLAKLSERLERLAEKMEGHAAERARVLAEDIAEAEEGDAKTLQKLAAHVRRLAEKSEDEKMRQALEKIAEALEKKSGLAGYGYGYPEPAAKGTDPAGDALWQLAEQLVSTVAELATEVKSLKAQSAIIPPVPAAQGIADTIAERTPRPAQKLISMNRR